LYIYVYQYENGGVYVKGILLFGFLDKLNGFVKLEYCTSDYGHTTL